MNWFADFSDCIRQHAPLAPFTWYKIGGPARWLIEPRDEAQLAEIARRCHEQGVEMRVLGRGANLLVGDAGVDAAVIRLTGAAFERVDYRGATVAAGAGADLLQLVKAAARRGLTGLEVLAGIPATIGGAIRMNCGGRHGEIGPLVASVRTLTADGRIRERRDVAFAYRRAGLEPGEIVLAAELNLVAGDPAATSRRYDDIWREKTASQPALSEHSAGCVFKNPPGDHAGRMIDLAGLKGTAVGRARVSRVHANFIVADDGASAAEVLALIRIVQDRVAQRTGVMLETEVEIWDAVRPEPATRPVRNGQNQENNIGRTLMMSTHGGFAT